MTDAPQPIWDQAFADELLGKTVLVGLTYVNDADEATVRCRCMA